MKTLTAFMLALAASVTLSAQIPGYPNGCEKCGLKSEVDWVQMADLGPEGRKPVIAGWAFECFSGHTADRVYVYALTGGHYVNLKAELRWRDLPRPDVQAVWAPVCYNVPTNAGVGFGIVILDDLPADTTRLSIAVGWGAYQQTHSVTVLR